MLKAIEEEQQDSSVLLYLLSFHFCANKNMKHFRLCLSLAVGKPKKKKNVNNYERKTLLLEFQKIEKVRERMCGAFDGLRNFPHSTVNFF